AARPGACRAGTYSPEQHGRTRVRITGERHRPDRIRQHDHGLISMWRHRLPTGVPLATTGFRGLLNKLSGSASQFLNGQNVFAAVKDSDLSLSDITTNDVGIAAHGFAPKAATDGAVLRRSGASVGFGAADLASANAVIGVLPTARGGT